MNEVDDRLAGDPVWELFPYAAQHNPPATTRRHWLAVAGLVGLAWLVFPPLAVVTGCLAVVAGDFRNGRQLARSIPDKAGASVCARFAYAWWTWKLGGIAFLLMFVMLPIWAALGGRGEPPGAVVAALLLVVGGFALSAALTVAGLLAAYRAGMRIWIGEGANQAGTLLLSLIVLVFAVVILLPLAFWLIPSVPPASAGEQNPFRTLLGFLACLLVSPFIILVIFERLSRRLLADRPGKFGSKVPTVGKWDFQGPGHHGPPEGDLE